MEKCIKKRASFIETDDGRLFLPRPTSVFAGQGRHIWFEKLTGECPSIASPDYWNLLLEKGNCLKCLVEYDDDTWKYIPNGHNSHELQITRYTHK